MLFRSIAAAVLAGLLLPLAAAGAAPFPTPAFIEAAIADPTRPQADRDKDESRHPGELLAFAGVKPGDVVVDVWPGSGYWTRLYSRIVGPKGHVIALVFQETAGFKNDPVALARAVAAEPGQGNVEVVVAALAAEHPPRDSVDIVWTFENYHDLYNASFMQGADVGAFDRAIFNALKPGGAFVIGDHAAAAGSGRKNTDDLHRIDPAVVVADEQTAGFRLGARSEVLANPADPHTAKVFDPAIRGATDRFLLRFVKPGP